MVSESVSKRASEESPVGRQSFQGGGDGGVLDDEARDKMAERESFIAGLGRNEKLRIVKNVAVLGIAFMVHFTAFHGTANLQSSVNADASLGTFTMASIYGSLILSNIFLPVIVIRFVFGFQVRPLPFRQEMSPCLSTFVD